MSRLFTFGCSFTQYAWPTWANIIAYDKDIEFYNYALAGLGNVGIYHRIVEADLKHNFNSDDEIMILWSSWSREDRVRDQNWLPSGSVLNPHNENYDRKFVKRYWDFNNDIVKNSTAIISANKIYKDLIKWQASSFDFFTVEDFPITHNNATKNIIGIYKDSLPELRVIQCETKTPFNVVRDSHPDVLGHLDIANIVYKDLNLEFKESTISRFHELQKDIQIFANIDPEFDRLIKKVDRLLEVKYADIKKIVDYRSLEENWHRR